VVGAARGHVHAATAHAFDDRRVRHVDFKHEVDVHAGALHGFGLRNGAGETVEQEALGAVWLRDAFLDQADDDVVTDQLASVHHLLGLQPERGAGLDGRAQHVAGRDLGDTVVLAQKCSLGAFAGAGGAQENEFHGSP